MGSPRIMGVSRPRISNPMRGMINLFLGRASVLSSDVHVGLACSDMPDCFAKSGSWRTRADLEIGVKISYAELRLVGEDCWPASGILMNCAGDRDSPDRKSTRLNSSHLVISY